MLRAFVQDARAFRCADAAEREGRRQEIFPIFRRKY
jgi:hypothetical protein